MNPLLLIWSILKIVDMKMYSMKMYKLRDRIARCVPCLISKYPCGAFDYVQLMLSHNPSVKELAKIKRLIGHPYQIISKKSTFINVWL